MYIVCLGDFKVSTIKRCGFKVLFGIYLLCIWAGKDGFVVRVDYNGKNGMDYPRG